MENKVKGIIKGVNKTGVLIDGYWYNAVEKAVNYVNPEIKGKEATLTLVSETTFNHISLNLRQKEAIGNGDRPSNIEDMRRIRSMCAAYSKDLWVADKITKEEFITVAQSIFTYIMDGIKDD